MARDAPQEVDHIWTVPALQSPHTRNLGVTTMSQTETIGSAGDLEVRESANGNLCKLIELARQAYEQKRTKDCLDLTRAILLIDPDNAQQIQNVIAPEQELSWLTNSIETVPVPETTPPATEKPLTAYRSSAVVPPPPDPVANEPQPVIAAAAGTLAVSAQTPVDIYKDDAYLGAAPVSLELPAGTHTLEYRHGSLRKYVTHVINSNETTKTMITFDVSVQINSKPWAAVFIDGVEKKALGQTPLSGVRVPIGSILIFENPRFQTKTYRVTGNETGIQIVFQ